MNGMNLLNSNVMYIVNVLQADEKEWYSMQELLSDLSECQARQVHIVADQSYSGVLARAVKRSKHHSNVVVFSSSKDHEYSFGTDFTRLWTSTNHTHQCVQDVHKVSWTLNKLLVIRN